MYIATEQLCKELYKASGRTWKDTYMRRYYDDGMFPTHEKLNGLWLPAYDLGYLLRKLENTPTTDHDIQNEPAVILEHSGVVKPEFKWCAKVFNGDWYEQDSNSMEDAVAKLAIELFKQGILNPTKQENK